MPKSKKEKKQEVPYERRRLPVRNAQIDYVTKLISDMPTNRTIKPRSRLMLNTGHYDPKLVEEADAADAADDVYARKFQRLAEAATAQAEAEREEAQAQAAEAAATAEAVREAIAAEREAQAQAQAAEAAEDAAREREFRELLYMGPDDNGDARDEVDVLTNDMSRISMNEINMNEIGGGYRKNKSRRHKTRRHKSRRHKTRRHKTRRHKSRR
jgi:hypothetical protein